MTSVVDWLILGWGIETSMGGVEGDLKKLFSNHGEDKTQLEIDRPSLLPAASKIPGKYRSKQFYMIFNRRIDRSQCFEVHHFSKTATRTSLL